MSGGEDSELEESISMAEVMKKTKTELFGLYKDDSLMGFFFRLFNLLLICDGHL